MSDRMDDLDRFDAFDDDYDIDDLDLEDYDNIDDLDLEDYEDYDDDELDALLESDDTDDIEADTPRRREGSVLAVDFGSVTTRVNLVDVVDGQYRLVAQGSGATTLGYPVDDVSVGLQRIIRDIARVSGRRFYDDDDHIIIPENIDRSGVDYFVTTASAGRPLRAVIVGLFPQISIASALRAIASAYIEPIAIISLQDEQTEEERLNTILLSRPDLIIIVGGTDDGARSALLDILNVVHLAVTITDNTLRPEIIYAGNRDLAETVRDRFSDLTAIFVADNLRPTIKEEHFESVSLQLGQAYDQYKERHNVSFRQIGQMSSTGLLPTARSYTLLADFYMQAHGYNLLAVDAGSATAVLVAAYDGQVDTAIGTTLGTGHSAVSLLETVGEAAIADWLPFIPDHNEIQNYALNKSLRPQTIPMTLRENYLEHALLRAGIRHMVAQHAPRWRNVDDPDHLPPVDLILAGGASLTGTGNPAYDMLLIVDALQPTGITEILADLHGLIPAMGAIAQVNPEAVVQLLDGNNLDMLGTVISVSGQPGDRQRAVRLKIQLEDGESFEREIPGGHLILLPLPPGETLEIQLNVARGLSIGGRSRIKRQIKGGTAGIMIDVRGRPLNQGSTPQDRAANMPQWLHEVTDMPLHTIPEDWLIPPEDDEPDSPDSAGHDLPDDLDDSELALLLDDSDDTEDDDENTAPPRRGLFGFLRRRQPKSDRSKEVDFESRLDDDADLEDFESLLDEDDDDDDERSLRDLL